MINPFTEIAERVSSFMERESGDFEQISRDLFSLQFEHVPPYRRFCESRGITPSSRAPVPALPTTAFRDFPITSLRAGNHHVNFHSSGTTGQKPSRHYHSMESLQIYERSLELGFICNIPATDRTLSLTPSASDAPHSSLAHMMEFVQPEPKFAGIATPSGWKLDVELALKICQSSTTPITVMGTAFSFVHLCDQIDSLALPAGSRIFETGGYKNQSRELPKTELHQLIGQKLHVPTDHIHCEYGMCELSSQAYAVGLNPFRLPHWARARIVSPETGDEVDPGETGILEIVDLANVFSAQAVRTSDLAIRVDDGFQLVGRSPGSESRGCSLNELEPTRSTTAIA